MRNGLKQGLPSSCPFWLLYVEPFIRHLRDEPNLRGVTIPGELGHGTTAKKVEAFADDVKQYCANTKEVAYLMTKSVRKWYRASGQTTSVEKLNVVLLGTTINETLPDLPVKAWQRYGTDKTDKSLGIRVGNPVVLLAWAYTYAR